MIKDKIPDYFDLLTRLLDDEYGEGNVSYSQVKNDSPSQFPHVYFHQIGGIGKCATLSGTYDAMDITVEIIVYHDKGTSKTRKFANSIRMYMTEWNYGLRFKCDMFSPMDNLSDSKISMFVMRFSKTDTEQEYPQG